MTANVHQGADAAIARRERTGAPKGECGNCANAHGSPKNCLNPKHCIHGYSLAQRRKWAEDNPEWGKGRA